LKDEIDLPLMHFHVITFGWLVGAGAGAGVAVGEGGTSTAEIS